MLTHILISIDALAERNLAFAYRQKEYTSMARNKSIWHSSHSRNSHASGEAWRSPLHRNGHEDLQRTATVLQRCQHAEISDSPSPIPFFARTARPIRPGCAGCRQVTTGICEWAVARGDGGDGRGVRQCGKLGALGQGEGVTRWPGSIQPCTKWVKIGKFLYGPETRAK